MAYTTIDNPELYFQTKLYTGNGSTQSITFDGSENMQPDWVWVKQRSGTTNHKTSDSVRGATKALQPNDVDAEATDSDGITSFDSNGFSLGAGGDYNGSSNTQVAWCWKESATAGFDIVSYTGNGSSGLTVSHSLSAVPSVIIIKNRSGSYSWTVYHHKNTSAPETESLFLDTNDATADRVNEFNDTAPTSSIFTVGDGNSVNNSSENFIAYLFAEKQGYSKFGSYTGNGNADGTFIYTGFKPAWVMLKPTSTTGNWFILDNKRSSFNVMDKYIRANQSSAEATFSMMDFVSNGVKIKTSDSSINGSGVSYIYMAFAQSPFVTSTGIPTTAR